MLWENGSLLGYTMLDFKRSRMLCESSAVFARFGGAVRRRRQSNKWLILCFGDTKLAQVQQTTLSLTLKKKSQCAEFNTFVEVCCYAEGVGFCANILICVINAGYLSRALFLKGKGGTGRGDLLPSPWGNSVKCKQEAFEPQRLTPVVNPSVSDRGHRSWAQLHG